MDIELEKKQTLRREEAAQQLRDIADELASGNEINMEQNGLQFTVKVPDEVTMKVEVEIEDDEREFEIKLSW
ncbi:amphi-Trp domain-containing protein [Arthrobacter pityocampae]|uniref:Amphi-Trp domain-containing protein n=1 Tax=Arthrobacter pityocampae TaxID=547334 RepID=A0A2S5IZS2_9MICC|nr:amphi-Trp domain-containing protein [Arthrobacter pityocampae]PPB50033.1 amphi-Trp domain-containing protein [Arthrobacter pityocampae]